jgi:hypothetical protein
MTLFSRVMMKTSLVNTFLVVPEAVEAVSCRKISIPGPKKGAGEAIR